MSKLPHLEGSRSFRCPKCKACIEEPRSNVYQCPVCSSFHLTGNGGSGHSRNLSSLSGSSDRNALKNQEDNINGREESFGGPSIPEKARLIAEPSVRKEVPKGASTFTYSDSGIISPIWSSEIGSSGHEPVPSMDKGSTLVHHNPRSLGSLSKLSRARVIRYDREDSIDNLYEDDNTDHEGYEIDYQEEHSPPDGSSYDDINLISKQDFHSRISQRGAINRAERGSKDIRIDSLTVEPDEDFYMHDGLYGDRHKKDVEGLSAPSVTTPSEYVLERGETPRKAEMQGANDSPRSAALVWRGREGSSDSQGPGHDSIEQQSVNRTPKSRRTRAVSTEIKRTTEGGDTQASTLASKPDEISVVGQSSEISYHIQLPYQILIPATVISSTSTHRVEQSTGPIRKAHVPDLRDPKDSPSSSTHESYVCITPQSQACSTPVVADIDADGRSKLGTVKPSEPSLRMPKSYPPLPCKGGPPYIMCKHCYKVLRVPLYLPPNAGLRQKLQCGECQKVSKFYVPIQAINLTSKSGNSSHDYLFTMSFRSDKSIHGLHHDDLFTSSFKSAKSTDSAAHGDLYKYSPQRVFEHIEPEQDDFSDASSSGSQRSLHESYNKDNKEIASQAMESRQSSIAPGAPLIDHLTRSLRDLSPRSYRRLLLQTSMSKSTHLEDHGIPVDATTKEPEYTTTTRSTSNASSLYHHIENPGQGNRSKMSITSSSSTEDANKGGTSSYSGLLKALKDLRGGNSKVIVNGHTLKKEAIDLAQQKAGIIHPGTYWYDYKAGFWGVTGGPCQGIVMPSIEEFNFPLARDCSGGKTGICVNGRELHEKDLEVLSRRGLPKTYGKAYDVDILGNVTDTNTGQHLNTLRILAPSVLKKGRGCGMSPRT